MKNRKFLISIMAGVLAVVMVLSLIGSIIPILAGAAPSSSELKEQLDALKADKEEIDATISELEDQLSDNMTQMEQIVAQKNLIDQEIFMLHEKVDNINDQIATYSLLIADKQEELEKAEERLAELNRKNKERIRAMEEDGELSYWSVLFQANNFADFLDRVNMVEEIAASDRRRLKEMSEAAELVADAKQELETEKAALEQTKEELAVSQTELEKKRTEADGLLAQLIATGAEYEALLDQAEQNVEDLLNKIEEKEEEYDDAKYQEWLATSVPPTTKPPVFTGGAAGEGNNVNGATWLVPCDYVRVSSPYGYRIHPVYGDWRFHSGVDLSASSGTPIVASRSGLVTVATYDWSAGYYVTVDHLDGYETKYLHMTHYIVSEGQYVSAGQVIGYVGSTGTSTGAHLHFGVYYNGSSVNPANYVSVR